MAHPSHKGHSEDDRNKNLNRSESMRDEKQREKPRGGQTMVATTGSNWPAAITGWAIAFLSGLILSALAGVILAGVGATTATLTGLGIAGGIVGLVVWFIAYFIGGWTAGRVAKFNGLQQGLMVWAVGIVFMIILLIVAAIVGPSVALIGGLSVPVAGNLLTAVGLGAVVLLIVQLLGSLLGGWLSTRRM